MALLAEPSPPGQALAAIRAPFEAFGASGGGQWVDPPVLQPLNLLLDLAGEAMRARLFTVQGEGTQEACLRPDFTIAMAQAHIAAGARQGRYLYEGKAFRVAPPSSGRPMEFLQIGVELYEGPEGDVAAQDAEIAALAFASAEAGGRQDLSLLMGDVSLFLAFLGALNLPDAARARLARTFASGRGAPAELARAQAPPVHSGARLAELLSDLPETEASGVLEELWRLAGIQPVGGRAPAEIVHRLALRAEAARGGRLSPGEADLINRYLEVRDRPRAALEQIESLAYSAGIDFDVQLAPWVRRLKALDAAGVPEEAMILAAGFVRPFGYYDGLLFEVISAALGPERPVAAGGRYDGLPGRLGGAADGRAIGCMVRPARAWAGAA